MKAGVSGHYNGTMRISSLPLILLSALTSPWAIGQSDTADTDVEAEALPLYNVEVIIFAHNDVDRAEESFAPRPAAQFGAAPGLDADESDTDGDRDRVTDTDDAEDLLAVAPPEGQTQAEDAGQLPEAGPATDSELARRVPVFSDRDTDTTVADDPNVLEFAYPFGERPEADELASDSDTRLPAVPRVRSLAPEELTLGDAREIIDRLGAYQLLGHGGWQQAGLEQAISQPVDMALLGLRNPTGTLTLYLGRFLHVQANLVFRAPQSAAEPAAELVPAPAEESAASRFGFQTNPLTLERFNLAERFRLDTERNAMRSGELHYIDHPRFGVLILVTPAPEPEEPTDELLTAQPSA